MQNILEIISPVTGERLQVAYTDLEKRLTWEQAVRTCQILGNGWRLPTLSELSTMYTELHKNGLGNFHLEWHWSCLEASGDTVWEFTFKDGLEGCSNKYYEEYVRLVRPI